jgi:hypothetical protein
MAVVWSLVREGFESSPVYSYALSRALERTSRLNVSAALIQPAVDRKLDCAVFARSRRGSWSARHCHRCVREQRCDPGPPGPNAYGVRAFSCVLVSQGVFSGRGARSTPTPSTSYRCKIAPNGLCTRESSAVASKRNDGLVARTTASLGARAERYGTLSPARIRETRADLNACDQQAAQTPRRAPLVKVHDARDDRHQKHQDDDRLDCERTRGERRKAAPRELRREAAVVLHEERDEQHAEAEQRVALVQMNSRRAAGEVNQYGASNG